MREPSATVPVKRESDEDGEPRRPRGTVTYVVDRLRSEIFDGRMMPGHRLVEADLTQSLNVSRSTVREALNRLAADGLVQIEPNRGAWVTRTSRKNMRNIFIVRELLEGQGARQVAENAARPLVREMLEQLRATELARDTKLDALSFMAANQQFHDAILALSESEILQRMVRQLQLPQFRAVFFRSFSSRIYEQSTAEHVAILDAMIATDGDLSDTLMRRHVRGAADLVLTMSDDIFAP
jgi:DNA-binding GntR family transcriptional regulator